VDRLRRCFPASIRSALAGLPESLDKTYEQTLLGIDKEKREYAQRLFKCLSVSIRPLSVEELAEIFAVQFDTTTPPSFNKDLRPQDAEEAVLSACSSLVAVVDREGSQMVQFSHFSVKEFLTSERLATAEESLSYYHILPEPAHTILAHASLSVLLQLDGNIDRDTIGHFPLAPYAARHWVDHARFRLVSLHIEEVMERLFDPAKPHFSAWVWLHDIDRHWLEPMPNLHPTRPEAMPLYYASLCGFGTLVEHLIASHSWDIESRGGSHTTALHAATVEGHFDVASLLLKHGADCNSRDDCGRAPLHRVSQGGQVVMAESSLEIARLLVKSGANVNVTDIDGWTPLHAAAKSGYREIAELLLESDTSLDLDVWNKKQQTPLHVACYSGKLDVSRFLIDRGSDKNSREENGFAPLSMASRYGHVDIARLLLDRGSDVNVRDTQGWKPLHYASRYGYHDLARLLLIDRGADVNAHKDDRWTPLHLASAFGHTDITKLLVEGGAIVDSQNDREETPLERAAWNGYLDTAHLLVESGAAVSSRSNNGWIPFHTASYFGHPRITKLLLECGIDVDIRNGSEETSLHLSSSSGKLDVARFLIEHGADLHAKDNNGWNPLHIASQNGHLDVVRMLINAGVAVDIRGGTEETSLALASSKGKVEVGRFLIEQGPTLMCGTTKAGLHYTLPQDMDILTWHGCYWTMALIRTSSAMTSGTHYIWRQPMATSRLPSCWCSVVQVSMFSLRSKKHRFIMQQ
jgi:ankyrin repeat protein